MAGETDDLATLASLDEAVLLQELKRRYEQDKIYTYLGDVLVAVNPFKKLHIYETKEKRRYHHGRSSRSESPPHVFAVASTAYHQMMATGKNQCCVISGESGAGKTETAKLIVAQLIELSHGRSVLEQRILQVNPLLEAFGNAATVMNSNSSRFGKYLQLKFKDGHVTGAKINEYLLEKSRVVYQNEMERNFHVFYCMLAGLSQTMKAQLSLENPDEFKYLCDGAQCLHKHYEEIQQQFEDLQNALDLVGFESELQDEIFGCLAAVLHLGNVQFMEDDKERSHILDPQTGPLKLVSELLGVEFEQFGALMTVSVKLTRGEVVKRLLDKQKAAAARDALAKAIYDRIFRWIVNRINRLLAPTIEDVVDEEEIGILDIFGFECFERNSFEQLCINLANEQLQYFFNQHIFAMELKEYEQEGVSAIDVHFQDNSPLLDLFLGKPLGLLSLLDEQSKFPQATDSKLVVKFNDTFKKKKTIFIASKGSASGTFAIQHYAGKVVYNSFGFLDKNRDSLPGGGVALLKTSSVSLIQLVFTATITRTGTLAAGRLANRRSGKRKKEPLAEGGPVPAPRTVTVGAQFKNSLQVLIEKLNRATPHFIRCIKPNAAKVADQFDDDCVTNQLRYTGMLETVRIRREGFAYRPTFEEFIERYESIVATADMDVCEESCQHILEVAKLTDYQLGETKVFLKYWHVDQLNGLMDDVCSAVLVLQKVARGFIQRCKYKVFLATKQEEEKRLASFLTDLSRRGEWLLPHQQGLVEEDEGRARENAEEETKSDGSSSPSGTELEEVEVVPPCSVESMEEMADLSPPNDLLVPPPEPKINIDSDEDEENTLQDSFTDVNDGDSFIAPSRNAQFKKFGREGTRQALIRWFKETQADKLYNSEGTFPEWFHGDISRRQAEQLLQDKPVGTFLVRVCENRFGYSLSFRGENRCQHFMISQLETGKYTITGKPRVHGSLEEMIAFHKKHPLNHNSDTLTMACDQPHTEQLNFSEVIVSTEATKQLPCPPPDGQRTTS